jgi:hypothetical protein
MSGKIYNLLGTQYDTNWLLEHIDDLVPFDEAAMRVHIRWTRHYLHKHIFLGRIDKRRVIVQEDMEMLAVTPSSYSQGKKFFIFEDELDLLIAWYDDKNRRKNNFLRCRWCDRIGKNCINNPCNGRKNHARRVKSYERIRQFTGRSK